MKDSLKDTATAQVRQDDASPRQAPGEVKPRLRVVPVLITLIVAAIAAALSWAMWNVYMTAPWTRDATVRAYVVTIAPQISGLIVKLPVLDNQLVRTTC